MTSQRQPDAHCLQGRRGGQGESHLTLIWRLFDVDMIAL